MSSIESFSNDQDKKNNQIDSNNISNINQKNNEKNNNNEKDQIKKIKLQKKASRKISTQEKDNIQVTKNYFSLVTSKDNDENQQNQKDNNENVSANYSKKNDMPFQRKNSQGLQKEIKKNNTKTISKQASIKIENSNEIELLNEETDYERLQKKTAELKNELKEKQREIEIEKNNSCQIVTELNLSIDEKQKEMIKLNGDNKKLMNELKDIKNEVNNKLKLVKIFDIKNENLNDIENNLKKIIIKTDKEIETQKNNQKIVKKEKERYRRLLKTKDTVFLIDELNNLNKEINSRQTQLKILTRIKDEHKNCIKEIKNLSNRYNIIKNDCEFEQKKLNMSLNEEPLVNNKYINKANSNDYLIANKINKKKLAEIKSRNKKNLKIKLFLKSNIWNEFDSAHEKHVLTSCDIRNNVKKNLLKNESAENMQLFTEEESQVLKKIIPKNILESYQSKFETIGYKRKEVEQKFKINDFKKKEIQQTQDRIDFSSLQMKEIKKREMQLRCEVNKYRKKISDITTKINNINNLIKEQKQLYDVKYKEYNRIIVHVQNMQNRVNNGELVRRKEKKEKKKKK